MSTIDQEAMAYTFERLAGPRSMAAVTLLFERPDGMDWPAYLGTTADVIIDCLISYWTREADYVIREMAKCEGVSQDIASALRPWRDADNGGRSWARERAAQTWAIYALA